MSQDVRGRIEVRPSHLTSPDYWRGVVDLSAIDLRDIRIYGLVFGIPLDEETDKRGLPKNASPEVKQDYRASIPDVDYLTWYGWDEVYQLLSRVVESGGFAGDWAAFLALGETLGISYGRENVRVVWWLR